MIIYSIILPYYNRKSLLINTLNSFVKFYSKRNDLEIIIIDDGSSVGHKLDDAIKKFDTLKIKLVSLGSKKNNMEVNPCYPYNVGVRNSSGKILILSSPETFHTTNMFEITNNFEKLNDSSYLLLSVFCSTSNELTESIIENNFIINDNNREKLLSNVNKDKFNNKYGSWYLHSIFRKTDLNFFSCITRKTYYDLCGFDERYRNGTGYADNEFLNRLKNIVNKFIYYDNAIAIHVNHEVVHNLPPTTNYNLYLKNEPYYKNDKWGLINNKKNNDTKKIGFFTSFGLGGADHTSYVLCKNLIEYFTKENFCIFFNKYSLSDIKKNEDNQPSICRYKNYLKFCNPIRINNVSEFNNYDLDILFIHRGGDEFWLLPNFETTDFNFKIIEINFHGKLKTKADLRIFPSKTLVDFRKIICNHKVIPNPIIKYNNTENLRNKLNIQDKFVVGRLGNADFNIYCSINLTAYKNIESNNTVFLYLNPSKKAIEDSRKLKIKNIIFLEPTVDSKELMQILNTFDVHAHSNNHGETFGNSIAESFIHGICTISHEGFQNWPQAHKEFFKNTPELFVTKKNRETMIKEYSDILRRLKDDVEYRCKKSQLQKDYALKHFEKSIIIKKYIETIENL